ncbi:hypothetical protein, partial [Lacticaseibacillus manihotivorans]|uniref:hypothetical protein n=1 Tax=Lacticaseibacillus manihotivorans TaxID=88233 RepID=UPI000ACDA1BE
ELFDAYLSNRNGINCAMTMFDQTVVGKVQIKNGEVESADLAAQPGRYEVNLTFSHVDHFALQKIVFS